MKKIIGCIILLLVSLIIFYASKTYAIYVDEYNNNTQFKVANWKIVVNNEDITLNTSKNFIIDNYEFVKNDDENSDLSESNNKFAPGMSVKFDILIDVSKVDVAFDYFLDIDTSEIGNDNIVIDYVTNTLNNIEYDGTYHGYANLDTLKNNKQDIITVGLKWLDNDEFDDFEWLEKQAGNLNIPLKITFKQKTE